MRRITSQLIFCSPERILRRTVVERNEQQVITNLFSLDEKVVESAQTLFFDGVLSGGIVSLKENISTEKIAGLLFDYNYQDISEIIFENKIRSTEKPLVLDFGTTILSEINTKFKLLADDLTDFSLFEIIAACVYFPAKILGDSETLTVGRQVQLLLWEGTDLVNKCLTATTSLRKI